MTLQVRQESHSLAIWYSCRSNMCCCVHYAKLNWKKKGLFSRNRTFTCHRYSKTDRELQWQGFTTTVQSCIIKCLQSDSFYSFYYNGTQDIWIIIRCYTTCHYLLHLPTWNNAGVQISALQLRSCSVTVWSNGGMILTRNIEVLE